MEILSSYITDVSVGDLLTVQALVANPLDWHHFYDKLSTIKSGDRTEFTIVTSEGERVIGIGDVIDIDKWSNAGQYHFKIKVKIKKQKSLNDRRTRLKQKSIVNEEKLSPFLNRPVIINVAE